MDPRSTVIIANPMAAAGRVGRQWPQLLATLRGQLGDLMIRQTRAPGQAEELAAQSVRNGAHTILSLGGDGTHSEVANGILRSQPAPGAVAMGILPAGTGGDFRRLLIGGQSLKDSAWALRAPEASLIDVGRLSFTDHQGQPRQRYFLNLASFGIGGLIDQIVNASSKRLGGKASFTLGTVQAFFQYKPARVRLTLDGQALGEHRITNVIVANGRYSGGGMCFAPHGKLNDGLFDIVILQHARADQLLPVFKRLRSADYFDSPLVQVHQGALLEAEALDGTKALLDVDGEALGRVPARLELVPRALRLLNVQPQVLA